MTTLPVDRRDLALASVQALVAISFVRSSAMTYQPAVEIARQAMQYDELSIGRSLVHCAVFGRSKDEAARAYSCLRYVARQKGTTCYAGGQIVQNKNFVSSTLQCYLNACACSDPAAYCCYMHQDIIVPCQQLRHWFHFDSRLPSCAAAQLEAAAIRRGVNWCPAFIEWIKR